MRCHTLPPRQECVCDQRATSITPLKYTQVYSIVVPCANQPAGRWDYLTIIFINNAVLVFSLGSTLKRYADRTAVRGLAVSFYYVYPNGKSERASNTHSGLTQRNRHDLINVLLRLTQIKWPCLVRPARSRRKLVQYSTGIIYWYSVV